MELSITRYCSKWNTSEVVVSLQLHIVWFITIFCRTKISKLILDGCQIVGSLATMVARKWKSRQFGRERHNTRPAKKPNTTAYVKRSILQKLKELRTPKSSGPIWWKRRSPQSTSSHQCRCVQNNFRPRLPYQPPILHRIHESDACLLCDRYRTISGMSSPEYLLKHGRGRPIHRDSSSILVSAPCQGRALVSK